MTKRDHIRGSNSPKILPELPSQCFRSIPKMFVQKQRHFYGCFQKETKGPVIEWEFNAFLEGRGRFISVCNYNPNKFIFIDLFLVSSFYLISEFISEQKCKFWGPLKWRKQETRNTDHLMSCFICNMSTIQGKHINWAVTTRRNAVISSVLLMNVKRGKSTRNWKSDHKCFSTKDQHLELRDLVN